MLLLAAQADHLPSWTHLHCFLHIAVPTLSGVVIAPFFLVCQLKPSWGLPAEEGTCPELDLAQQAERVLFIGWRRDIADLIQVLDDFVAPGSELWLYNEV